MGETVILLGFVFICFIYMYKEFLLNIKPQTYLCISEISKEGRKTTNNIKITYLCIEWNILTTCILLNSKPFRSMLSLMVKQEDQWPKGAQLSLSVGPIANIFVLD